MDFVLILRVLSTVVIPGTCNIDDITFLNPNGQAILWYTVTLYSQAKPSQAKVLTEGGDLRFAQVDIPLSVSHSCA